MMNGFTLKRIITNDLPDDEDSMHYAALLEWNNIDYKPNINKTLWILSWFKRTCTSRLLPTYNKEQTSVCLDKASIEVSSKQIQRGGVR